MKKITSIMKVFWASFFSLGLIFSLSAQENGNNYRQLEKVQEENDFYYMKVYDIIMEYPEFSYEYEYENDELQNVIVYGVTDEKDRERLEVWLYDLRANKDMIQNIPTRTGIYYSVEEEAEPKNELKGIYNVIMNNINYPDEAEDKGVEGTVYVQFVVDSKGDVVYAQASEDIETPYTQAVDEFKKQAIEAVKATSGEWEPAEIDGHDVASWVVLPINFEFKKDPAIRAMIR
ncbi:MAG: energy transducer TonB [Bacteroidota bacterium]